MQGGLVNFLVRTKTNTLIWRKCREVILYVSVFYDYLLPLRQMVN